MATIIFYLRKYTLHKAKKSMWVNVDNSLISLGNDLIIILERVSIRTYIIFKLYELQSIKSHFYFMKTSTYSNYRKSDSNAQIRNYMKLRFIALLKCYHGTKIQ